jgi:hypothetical protein
MKKVLFIVAGMLFAATATFAQDSTRTQQPQTQQSPEQTQTQNYSKDMIKIKSNDLPEAVKQTLAAPQYQGWESSTVYRSKNSDMYFIEMGTGAQAKTFRFGADGKPILE